jgi:hypothetical protein
MKRRMRRWLRSRQLRKVRGGGRSRSPIPTRRRIGALVALGAAAVAVAAIAYWSATGSGSAAGSVGKLAASTISSATAGAGTVQLSWTTVAPPGSGPVTYYVTRNGGAPAGNCPSASSPAAVTSCTDSGLSAGNYEYTVTAVWRSWTAKSAAKSVEVASGAATHLVLAAATTNPTAGEADNLTITAKDAGNITVGAYTGSKNLTFSGAGTIGANNPTVTNNSGTATALGSTTAITFTSGVATVKEVTKNGVMKLYKAETAMVVVSDGTISNGAGLSVVVKPAGAASFTVPTPATQTAGTAFEETATAKDAFGNVATGYEGAKTITFSGPANSPSGEKPKYPASVSFSAGLGKASITLYDAQTTTVTAKEGSIEGTSGSFEIKPAGAASFTVPTPATQTAGTAFEETATAKDAFGNVATGYEGAKTITFSGPANSPSGEKPKYPASVSFSAGLGKASITLYDAQTTTLTAKEGSIEGTSGSFEIKPAGAAKSLSLSAASTSPAAGEADNLTITALDEFGNTATSYTGSKELSFSGASAIGANSPTVTNSSGTATAFGTKTAITFASGVATVKEVTKNGVMKLYKAETAKLVVSDGTISNGAGLSVTVSSAAAKSVSLSAASTAPAAGEADNLTIAALDEFGNTATSYTGSHELSFSGASAIGANNPTVSNSSGTATNFGTKTAITFANGVASPTTAGATGQAVMKLYKAETAKVVVSDGTISNGAGLSVTVKEAAASKLVFTTQPVGGVTEGTVFGTQPVAKIEDSFGNVETSSSASVALAINSYTEGNGGSTSGTLGCSTNPVTASSGVATFTGCNITGTAAAGTYTLKATSSGLSEAISGNLEIKAGSASKLAFTTQPVGGVAEGTSLATQPVVKVEDANGNVVTSSSAGVTLAIANNSYIAGNGGSKEGSLSCTTNPVSASSGTASYAGCKITGTEAAGTYTLKATSGSLTEATSSSFEIKAGTPTTATFSTQPAGANEGAAFTTQPQVTIKDANSNLVSGSVVTLAIGTNPGGGTLSCTANPAATNGSGIAVFAGCTINKTGSGYTLTATDGSATATSSGFNVGGPIVTAVSVNNKTGGTLGKPEAGDTIVMTYSADLKMTSICSASTLGNTSSGSITPNANSTTVKLTKEKGTQIAFTSTDCTLHLGSLSLGTSFVGSKGTGTLTFAGSSIAWNGSSTITVTLGGTVTGEVAEESKSQSNTFTPDKAVTDPSGNAISEATFSWSGTDF